MNFICHITTILSFTNTKMYCQQPHIANMVLFMCWIIQSTYMYMYMQSNQVVHHTGCQRFAQTDVSTGFWSAAMHTDVSTGFWSVSTHTDVSTGFWSAAPLSTTRTLIVLAIRVLWHAYRASASLRECQLRNYCNLEVVDRGNTI